MLWLQQVSMVLADDEVAGEFVDREEVLVVAVSTGDERARCRSPSARRTRPRRGTAACRSARGAARSPTTLGTCVFACRPFNSSRPSDRGTRSAWWQKRSASARCRAAPVMAYTSPSTSFMPPCSTRSICWNASSFIPPVASTAQSTRRTSTSRAVSLPHSRCASRSPARILWSVYQGTPIARRPAIRLSSCVALSGKAQISPVLPARWQASSSPTM